MYKFGKRESSSNATIISLQTSTLILSFLIFVCSFLQTFSKFKSKRKQKKFFSKKKRKKEKSVIKRKQKFFFLFIELSPRPRLRSRLHTHANGAQWNRFHNKTANMLNGVEENHYDSFFCSSSKNDVWSERSKMYIISFLRMWGGEFIIDRLICFRAVFLLKHCFVWFCVCVCLLVCEIFFSFQISFNVQFLPYVHILITFFDSDNLTDQFTCIYILFIIQIILQNVWKCWNVYFSPVNGDGVGRCMCVCTDLWWILLLFEQFYFI